jgi:hypothetical protein
VGVGVFVRGALPNSTGIFVILRRETSAGQAISLGTRSSSHERSVSCRKGLPSQLAYALCLNPVLQITMLPQIRADGPLMFKASCKPALTRHSADRFFRRTSRRYKLVRNHFCRAPDNKLLVSQPVYLLSVHCSGARTFLDERSERFIVARRLIALSLGRKFGRPSFPARPKVCYELVVHSKL